MQVCSNSLLFVIKIESSKILLTVIFWSIVARNGRSIGFRFDEEVLDKDKLRCNLLSLLPYIKFL